MFEYNEDCEIVYCAKCDAVEVQNEGDTCADCLGQKGGGNDKETKEGESDGRKN